MSAQVMPRTISALDDVIAPILSACESWTHDAGLAIVAHGSRVEGFANASSDVDFWIVAPQGAQPPMLPVFEWQGDFRLQPESVSWDTLAALADRINAVDARAVDALLALSSRDLDTYYRFATSVPIANGERLAALRRRFSQRHIAAMLACRSGAIGATELERAALFAESGDELEESVCLRRAVEFSVDAFLAENGEAYPNRKWRFEKLARRFGQQSSVLHKAWALKSRESTQPIEDYRAACRAFVASLGLEYAPVQLRPSRAQSGTVFRLARMDFLLVPSTAVYEMRSTGVLVWDLIDGRRTTADVIAAAATRLGESTACATRTVHVALRDFRALGLVEFTPVFD